MQKSTGRTFCNPNDSLRIITGEKMVLTMTAISLPFIPVYAILYQKVWKICCWRYQQYSRLLFYK